MWAVRLADAGEEAKARRIDKIALVVLLAMFFDGIALIVAVR